MITISQQQTGVGREIRLRDYSEPLQNQKVSSFGTRYVYPIDFSYNQEANLNLEDYRGQLIRLWRLMAKNQYVDFALDDIVNEIISVTKEKKYPISLDLNDTYFSDKIKSKIHYEFENIQRLMHFDVKSYGYLRDWYIDGQEYFYFDWKEGKGITEIKQLDPIRLIKINDERTRDYYYIYKDVDLSSTVMRIDKRHIIDVNSGLMDDKHNIYISYLNKAYIPLNQLTSIEDAMLIYRIARAPERRVFYIDTGQLPKSKAETYMKEVIRNCRNKMEYDPSTGKIKESVLHMSVLDDIYLPRSAEGRGTEVSTLPGGQANNNLEDLDYFKMKLFRALNVPFTRWSEVDSPSGLLGRSVEITRDEVKYRKFIVRLRGFYNRMFLDLLHKQLIIKNIITETEFKNEADNIVFEWTSDSMFAELRDLELQNERMNMVDRVANYIGQFFSKKYVMRNILNFNDEQIGSINKEIKQELVEQQAASDPMNGMMAGGLGADGTSFDQFAEENPSEKDDSGIEKNNDYIDDFIASGGKESSKNDIPSIDDYIKSKSSEENNIDDFIENNTTVKDKKQVDNEESIDSYIEKQ